MTYHKGFLKLAIVPGGTTTATQGWWLDLRRGLSSIPSWWGPHALIAPSCYAVSQVETTEPDRGWQGIEGSARIELMHQVGKYTEGASSTTIQAVLETMELDAGRPLDRKLWKRVRALGYVAGSTALGSSAVLDGGRPFALDQLPFTAGTAMVWDATWDATWGQTTFVEAEAIMDAERPRGRALTLTLTHNDPVALSLREIELRYDTVARPTRATTDQTS